VLTELGVGGRVRRVLVDGVGKLLALLVLLYTFISSLDLLSSAFRLVGGRTTGQLYFEINYFEDFLYLWWYDTENQSLSQPINSVSQKILCDFLTFFPMRL